MGEFVGHFTAIVDLAEDRSLRGGTAATAPPGGSGSSIGVMEWSSMAEGVPEVSVCGDIWPG